MKLALKKLTSSLLNVLVKKLSSGAAVDSAKACNSVSYKVRRVATVATWSKTCSLFLPTANQMGYTDRREVKQFQFTAWPDHGVPEHPAPFLQFIRRIHMLNPGDSGPIVTHCRSVIPSFTITELFVRTIPFCRVYGTEYKLNTYIVCSVADPDPGSGIGCFLTPGSGIRNRFFGKKFYNSLKIGPNFFFST
jgi:hypothetical protein